MLFSSPSLECGVTSKQLDLGVPSVCVCTALKFCHMEILFMSGWSQEEGDFVAESRHVKMCFCVRSDASAMSLKLPA